MTATRAWIVLVGLSAISTCAALLPSGPALAVAVLAIAGAKARVILSAYLRLAQAPAVERGFSLVLFFVLALFAVLAVAPALAGR